MTFQTGNLSNFKHGEGHNNKTVEYRTWSGIKERCYSKTNHNYDNYGGRGIVVCDEWRNDYVKFLTDMGRRPLGHTLDRIDVNGPYSKANCRWSTPTAQQRNRRNNTMVEWNGKLYVASHLAEVLGVTKEHVYSYIKVKTLMGKTNV